MIAVAAFLAYVAAAVIFLLLALDTNDTPGQNWGLFCVAIGLMLSMLGGAVVAVTSRNQ